MTYWLRERKDLEGSTSNNTLSSSVQINKMSSWDTNNGTNTFSDNSKMISPWKLLELAQKMRREVSVEDRRWNLKFIKKCFLESEALNWLKRQTPMATQSSEESFKEAVFLGNCMIDAGYISHVKDAQFYRRFFNDKKRPTKPRFFRFHMDKVQLSSFLLEASKSHKHEKSENLEANGIQISEEVKDVWNNIRTMKTNITLLSESAQNIMNVVQDDNSRILNLVLLESLSMLAIIALIFLGKDSPALSTITTRTTFTIFILQPIFLLFFSCRSRMTLQSLQAIKCLLETIAVGRVQEIKTFSSLPPATTAESTRDTTLLLRRLPLGESFRQLRNVTKKLHNSIIGSASISEKNLQEKCTVPPPSKWPHYPVLVTANNTKQYPERINVFDSKNGLVPIGVPFEFESELFRGTALFRFKGVPSDDEVGSIDYFAGRERRFQAIIQGRFKEELSCADVITGHEFDESFRNLPPAWVIGAGRALIKQLAPGVQLDLNSSTPRFFSLLAATSQAISVDTINIPDIRSREIPENCTAISDEFFQKSSSSRKRILSNPIQAARFSYGTDAVYTFDFYQHLLDVSTYELNLGLIRLRISESLNNQPIQILAKTTNGRYLWSFCVWHESLFSAQ